MGGLSPPVLRHKSYLYLTSELNKSGSHSNNSLITQKGPVWSYPIASREPDFVDDIAPGQGLTWSLQGHGVLI